MKSATTTPVTAVSNVAVTARLVLDVGELVAVDSVTLGGWYLLPHCLVSVPSCNTVARRKPEPAGPRTG